MSMLSWCKQDCGKQKGSPAEVMRSCSRGAGPSEKIRRTVVPRDGALAWHRSLTDVMTECHDIFLIGVDLMKITAILRRLSIFALIAMLIFAAMVPALAEDAAVEEAAIVEETVEAVEEAEEEEAPDTPFYNTFWALLPPIIAIALALITKEVYSSLLVGIITGGLLYANFNLETTMNHVLSGGIVASLSDSYNVGILLFLVILGALVCLMNKAGGSAAFGRWAQTHIKSRVGAQLASILLGCLIFIDDYFNCLTVGSVMRPVTDKHNISRAKLAYIIDATAAPVCIIAPISSWAAAVSGFAEDGQGFSLFTNAIPYNLYAILTIVMMVGLVLMKVDFGPMVRFEKNAIEKGDLFSGKNPYANDEETVNPKGKVLDLILPVIVLIITCALGMVYTGGFFSGEGISFQQAFSDSDASVGLAIGSAITFIFCVIYFLCRRTIKFRSIMESIPEGFKAMVPAILILTFAWSLKGMTDSLGAKEYVKALVKGSAAGFQNFLPAIVFLIACGLAFATGTSWGTFGMLIPIVQGVFSMSDPLGIVCISACMAGAVCGDHCSPISDTTIMASAGAQCEHVNHVSTQLPYAITCAAVSFVGYIISGFVPTWYISTPIAVVLMLGVLFVIKMNSKKKAIA